MSEQETVTTGSNQEAIIKHINDIQEQVDSVEAEKKDSLSEKEVFEILEGKGIEYKSNTGFAVYVPPMQIRQNLLLTKLSNLFSDMEDVSKMESALENICDLLAQILKCEKENLLDNFDFTDIRKLFGLMTHVTSKGNELFKKKKLSVSFNH